MTARIRFTDVERSLSPLLYDLLKDNWSTVYVGRERPDNKDTAVLLRRQGGTPSLLMDSPRVGINIWAPSDIKANDLSLDVMTAFTTLHLQGKISNLSMTGPAEVTNESTSYRRRYFSVDFRLRGTDLNI